MQKLRFGRVAMLLSVPFAAVAGFAPDAAQAYVGPGAGLTALGTVFALVAALLLAVVGFVWYPVKRLLKRVGVKGGAAERPGTPE